jgi:glycine cleavage system H protein
MTRERFRGSIPEDRWYDSTNDMWVKREDDAVMVGATSFGLHLAGEVIGFTAKPRGAEVARGRSLGTVESAKTVIAVRSPVSFVLSEANEALEERAGPINSDPYGAGWMARGRPTAWEQEFAALLDAAAYRDHVRALEPDAEIL